MARRLFTSIKQAKLRSTQFVSTAPQRVRCATQVQLKATKRLLEQRIGMCRIYKYASLLRQTRSKSKSSASSLDELHWTLKQKEK